MIKNIQVTLLYPPEQTWPGTMCKPNGSLAYPMLAGALLEVGIEVKIFDACVGNDKDDLNEVFYKSTPLATGMVRTGTSEERILEEVRDSDIVGITSIFTHQETMVLECVKLIKKAYPEKLIISGGVNARNRMRKFFDSGVDIICTSEAEKTIVDIAQMVSRRQNDWDKIPMISFLSDNKIVRSSATADIIWNLDDLPMPAWHLLPNERYWKIRRPHGGHFHPDEELRYASMMTSLGCPFACSYCHIASEKGKYSDLSGPIGRFRVKSDERVLQELEILKNMGVKQVFIEDDSIFGLKRRGIRLIEKIIGMGLEILDVNGVNIIHMVKKGVPDEEVIELLVKAGFRDITLAFESANDRIIRQYASRKWDINKTDVTGLIKTINKYDLRVAGNFMIGYPDETRQEIEKTVEYAKKRKADGLDAANFFLVMPLPGTPLFDSAVAQGYIPEDFDPDRMHWQKANMVNTLVPPQELEEIRDRAWLETNNSEYTKYKKEMIIDANTGEIHKVS